MKFGEDSRLEDMIEEIERYGNRKKLKAKDNNIYFHNPHAAKGPSSNITQHFWAYRLTLFAYLFASSLRLFATSLLPSGPNFACFLHFGWIFRVSPTETISLSEMIWVSTVPDHVTLS